MLKPQLNFDVICRLGQLHVAKRCECIKTSSKEQLIQGSFRSNYRVELISVSFSSNNLLFLKLKKKTLAPFNHC